MVSQSPPLGLSNPFLRHRYNVKAFIMAFSYRLKAKVSGRILYGVRARRQNTSTSGRRHESDVTLCITRINYGGANGRTCPSTQTNSSLSVGCLSSLHGHLSHHPPYYVRYHRSSDQNFQSERWQQARRTTRSSKLRNSSMSPDFRQL